MITTPYFKNLEFIAFKASSLRSQNNKFFDSLLNNGFSKIEALEITETESFIIPRVSVKKVCSNCLKNKDVKRYHNRSKGGINGLFAECKYCRNKKAKEYWVKSHKEHPEKNKEIEKFKRQRTLLIMLSEIKQRHYDTTKQT